MSSSLFCSLTPEISSTGCCVPEHPLAHRTVCSLSLEHSRCLHAAVASMHLSPKPAPCSFYLSCLDKSWLAWWLSGYLTYHPLIGGHLFLQDKLSIRFRSIFPHLGQWTGFLFSFAINWFQWDNAQREKSVSLHGLQDVLKTIWTGRHSKSRLLLSNS